MKRTTMTGMTLLAIGLILSGCMRTIEGNLWKTLIDRNEGLDNWIQVGDANWGPDVSAISADRGKGGFLVSRESYRDFVIRAEFWADHTTNSGIFIRLSDPKNITAKNSYEVNIYDQRPDPSYGTGAIVNFAKIENMPKAGGQWNVLEITAMGPYVEVSLNGVRTVQMRDTQFARGPFALQYGSGPKDAPGGIIRWRKVQVRDL